MSNIDDFEERRVLPYCNQSTGWDSKTVITMIGLFVAMGGSILASWLSLNTQLTTLTVTQELKFKTVEQHILSDQQKELQLRSQIDSLESTIETTMRMASDARKGSRNN